MYFHCISILGFYYTTTIYVEILYFLLHYMYFTALITSYFADADYKYCKYE